MGIDIIDKIYEKIDTIEEKCKINFDWYYHSIPYDKENITSILTEGIKCGELLNSSGDVYNGPYYISLSKITIPDNESFNYYTTFRPSFIIGEIEPIKCVDNPLYYDYIKTKDPRRAGLDGEYQYYYFIKSSYIKGIVYNLPKLIEDGYLGDRSLLNLLELINLLEELDIDIPIYDYSRRDKTLSHTIDTEKLKYYSKSLL